MLIEDLKTIASFHGADKWNSHWYAQHYERHFTRWRSRPLRLLEIGIGGFEGPTSGGASLRMWKQFFPLGTIVGLDINDKSGVAEDRIHVFQGSQTDTRVLGRIVDECGPFDLVVDNGSHCCEHVIATFEYLFQHGLKDDGVYAGRRPADIVLGGLRRLEPARLERYEHGLLQAAVRPGQFLRMAQTQLQAKLPRPSRRRSSFLP
jgi:hypothetical protein